MIIVDLNQVMLSNLLMQLGNHTNSQLDESMFRHMVLNSIRSYNKKFGNEFGEMVIACDAGNYWRKRIFPYYKANRKKAIEKSELNWKYIFECMNKIREELKSYFPYRVINVDTAEADDVIATLAFNYPEDKILILSGDKDFIQLHVQSNIKQYDPVRKKWIEHPNPALFLKEHIIKGDPGDGVPNVLSSDNCLVIGERQKSITKKRLEAFLDVNFISTGSYDRNYSRNEQLINLSYVPLTLQTKILDEYDNEEGKNRSKILGYFMDNKLKNLTEYISDF